MLWSESDRKKRARILSAGNHDTGDGTHCDIYPKECKIIAQPGHWKFSHSILPLISNEIIIIISEKDDKVER